MKIKLLAKLPAFIYLLLLSSLVAAADSEPDGMDDDWEIYYGLSVGDDDSANDEDADTLSNLQEFVAGTNPWLMDTDQDGVEDSVDLWPADATRAQDDDSDGMSDGWESAHGLDPMFDDSLDDPDMDGLSNVDEYTAGSHPQREDSDSDNVQDAVDAWPMDRRYGTDTDSDGLPDYFEMLNAPPIRNTPPYLDYNNGLDAAQDADGDGLTNLQEFVAKSDWAVMDSDGDGFNDNADAAPLNPAYTLDTDGDGLPDEYEIEKGLNPGWAEDWSNQDQDSDNFSNLQEYKAGTEPTYACGCQAYDTDGDSELDGADRFPLNPLYRADYDFDGIPEDWIDFHSVMGSGDQDMDGLTELYEFLAGTNPNQYDSDFDGEPDGNDLWPMDRRWEHDQDFDGIPDEWEYRYDMVPVMSIHPLWDDEDNDGLFDWQEFLAGSNPRKDDTDGDLVTDDMDPWPVDRLYRQDTDEDGLPDRFEILNAPPLRDEPPYLDDNNGFDAAQDDDGDGLSNLQEFVKNTDWTNIDTDGDGFDDLQDVAPLDPAYTQDTDKDGLPDEYEILYGQGPNDPDVFNWNFDWDNDGLSNQQEYALGTEPDMRPGADCGGMDSDCDGWDDRMDAYPVDANEWQDSDRDSMPDNWEQIHGLNEYSFFDANQDPDSDGLSNQYEFLAKTNPQQSDTDGDGVVDGDDVWPLDNRRGPDVDVDGVSDGWEKAHGLSLVYDETLLVNDEDGDGTPDLLEYENDTNPRDNDNDHDGVTDDLDLWPRDRRFALDTDSDGLPDEFEKAFAPPHKTSAPYLDYQNSLDALNDQDGDGMSTIDEFRQGSLWLTIDTDGDHYSDNGDVAPANPAYVLDSDSDSLPDEYEILHGLDPNTPDTQFDPDMDGLDHLDEFKRGTDPNDADSDDDGHDDSEDRFPLDPAEWLDSDFDGMPDNWENSYGLNPGSAMDGNGDLDTDGITNRYEYLHGSDPTQSDSDADTYADDVDDFPTDPAEHLDGDGDGVGNIADLFPLNPMEWADFEGDGVGDNTDLDDDGDGVSDVMDVFPLDVTEWEDSDGDSIGNNADTDDDNDGILDVSDNCSLYYNTNQLNTDGDSQGNVCDDDDDNDGTNDISDPFPLDASEWLDTDRDLIGNNADPDDDNDGMPDFTDPAALVMHNYPNLYTFNGDSAVDYLGAAVAGAGDVNNDGYDDLIAGAYLDDNNSRTNSGSARVYSGLTGTILYTFNGDVAYDWFGHSVDGAGDVNNDGYDDVIVGAHSHDGGGAYTDRGMARIFSGLNGAILYTFTGDSALDNFGYSVSGAGDVNQDGYADVIVGARLDANNGVGSGSAKVFSGANGSLLYTFNGDDSSDYMGHSVGAAGDVNGDGYDDVIVGAYGDETNGSYSGLVRVFSGFNGAILYTFNGDNANDDMGWSVDGVGDVNNDGYADIAGGAIFDDNNFKYESGSARVWSGKDGSILYTFNGTDNSDIFGITVRYAGDVDQDGYDDLIVGAASDDNNGSESGSARVLSGKNGAILYTFNGDNAEDYFGHSVSAAGDVNGDGYPDLFVGAYADDNLGRIQSGSARVFSGAYNFAYWDTDGDGYKDSQDAFRLDPAEWLDSDSDGTGNNSDTDDDNDGMPDIWEAQYALDPLDNSDAGSDPDGDGYTNLQEYQNGNNPMVFDRADSDYNNDGIADILWRKESTKEMRSWTMNGSNGYTAISFFPQYNQDNANWKVAGQGDIDGDGDADIVWRNIASGYNRAWIMEKRPNGQEVKRETLTFYPQFGSYEWSIVGIGDANKDGTEDIFFHNSSNGQFRIWEMDNTGNRQLLCFFTAQTVGYEPQAIDDFDGDGDVDVFWRNSSTGANQLWRLQNCALAETITLPSLASATTDVVGSGDFNHDNVSDLLWMNGANNAQSIWGMVNGNRDSDHVLPLPNAGDLYAGIADHDGDGTDDILYYNSATGYPRIWWMTNFARAGSIRPPAFGAGGQWSIINDGDN